MDFNSLKDQISNLTLYDVKAGVRKVQNGKSIPRAGSADSRQDLRRTVNKWIGSIVVQLTACTSD